MTPKFEFGHLYKFIVSLGFALMTLALLGPWAILREQGALMVTEAQLEALTPRAQRVLEAKQAHAEIIMGAYPWVALAALILGAFLSVWGLRQWRPRQGIADALENAELLAVEQQLEKLTPAETERRLDAEAVAAAPDADRTEPGTDSPEAPAAAAAPAGPGDAPEHLRMEDAPTIRQHIRALYAEVEPLAASRLEAAFAPDRRVVTDVKVMGQGDRVAGEADIVAISPPTSSKPTLIFDLKLTTAKNASRQTEAALLNAARSAIALRPHGAAAVALLIVNDEEEKAHARRGVTRTVERLHGVLGAPSGAVLLTTDELRTLAPAELRARILRAIRDPGGPDGADFAVSA